VKERSVDYFRERERAEREAAKNATCDAARWAHQEMAESYARMLQSFDQGLTEPVQPDPMQIEPRQTES
jgi:hypothetical protein